MAKIAVLNTKGGSCKSTNSFQVACAYFLQKNEKVELIEIDDENADSANFTESIISSKRLILGDGSKIEGQLFDAFGDRSVNQVVDIGGNKTTSAVIAAMAETKIYLNFDLFVIPIAGGYQDLQNAIKTTELIKPFGKPIIYSLSRARCDVSDVDGIYFQYSDFFSRNNRRATIAIINLRRISESIDKYTFPYWRFTRCSAKNIWNVQYRN